MRGRAGAALIVRNSRNRPALWFDHSVLIYASTWALAKMRDRDSTNRGFASQRLYTTASRSDTFMSQASLFDDTRTPSENIVLEAEDELNVDDKAEESHAPSRRFSITSYGADLSVFDLVRRIGKELLIPPAFQRKYVWNQKQASRFIESLLMGLPVPGVFIFIDRDKKQLIVDGQQRLITLSRFVSGVWEHRSREQAGRQVSSTITFKLADVADPWNGKSWSELEGAEQEAIYSSLIHATIFRQDQPSDHDRSIYEVFERINTGGSRLSSQEIRACVSHGPFVELLHEINANETWRKVYGKPSPRIKDEELILRFFAFKEIGHKYKRPMTEFLDDYLADHRQIGDKDAKSKIAIFNKTISALHLAVGKRLFRPEKALNAAVFDAVMVGCSTAIDKKEEIDTNQIANAYDKLLADVEFQDAYRKATADDENVKTRLTKSIEYFSR